MNTSFIGICLVATTSGACAPPIYSPWVTKITGGREHSTMRNIEKLGTKAGQLPLKIGLLADPQGTPEDLESVIKSMNTQDLEFILVLGDLTDFGLLEEFIQTYDSLEKSRVPYFTVIGNHDGISKGKDIYRQMFGPFDYSFEYAGLRFVMWNNNKYEFGTTNLQWLKGQLADKPIVNSHAPPVADAFTADEVAEWLQLYDSSDLVASIHGHRGTHESFFAIYNEVPIYTVPKTNGIYYSIAEFAEDQSVTFYKCKPECKLER